MAKSGSFTTKGYSDAGYPDHYVFSWSLSSQSVEGNYSKITWKLYGAGGSNSLRYTNVKEKYVTVNGTKKTSSSVQTTYNDTVAFSGTSTIYHNADGTKSFSASAGGAFFNFGSYNSTGSGSWSLPTIPRASSISGGSGNIGSTTTINISRASSSFTHTIKYYFGSLEGTIVEKTSATSVNWTIPTSFYSVIPNTNTGTGTLVCYTYNGNTLIGSKELKYTAKVTNSNPVVGSLSYKDSNAFTTAITENNQRIIREHSNLLFTIGTATPKNSATISKYEITFNGVTKSRTSAGDLDFGYINLASNSTAILKVTDSRGNAVTKEIEVIIDDWKLPTGIISLKRKNNFYSETYIKVDGTYSSLNGKNAMAIQYQYRKLDDKEVSQLYDLQDNVEETIELDNNYKWHVIVIVGDRIGETTYNLYLDRGMPIAFFDRQKESVGINCFPSQKGQLEVNGNMTASTKSFNSLNSLDRTGENQELYRSGLFSASVDNIWYNIINVRHRNGISDGVDYGLQIRNRFTAGYPLEYRQQNAGTWGDWKTIAEQKEKSITNNSPNNKSYIILGNLMLCWGAVNITPVANTPTKVSISYPKSFSHLPMVQTTPHSAVAGTQVTGVGFSNPSVTGCDIYVTRTNATTTVVHWLAIGNVN